MTTLTIILHCVVCFFLIVVVLLQHGKGADIGATFGGSSQTVFGTEGPTSLLNKITTISAIIFMLTSVGLAYLSSHSGNATVMEGYQEPPAVEQAVEANAPAQPAPETTAPVAPAPEPTAEPSTAAPSHGTAKEAPPSPPAQ